MLEAIADFWKPVKKIETPQRLKLTDMQIGSSVSFGYVPQAALSGRKLTVTAINSYQFGQDVLISFVLGNEKDVEVSMIIAEAQGEQYLAISRKISVDDRAKLFEDNAIDVITGKNEFSKFTCRDNVPELKGWLVSNYKREIQGMKGFLHRADLRGGNVGLRAGSEFQYTLLGSNSNEHAIEIESYDDGHVDVYATIYRRTNDISEVVHTPESSGNKIINIGKGDEPTTEADIPPTPVLSMDIPLTEEVIKIEAGEESVVPEMEIAEEEAKPTPEANEEKKEIKLSEELPPNTEELFAAVAESKKEEETEVKETEVKETVTESIKNNNEEKVNMSTTAVMSNEPKISVVNGQSNVDLSSMNDAKRDIKAANGAASGMDSESIECELRVANQIIDEAIRNEMRLSDVVRRVIELPVSHQESVHIPINLSDEDYSLLAIRYGISASDRNAIKARIIQDLVDFSGTKKR